MNNRIVVVYHSQDFDGIFSREVARQHFGDGAEYIGWDYSDAVPDIPFDVDTLFMIDVSVDALMNDPRLVWIDHHKTAIEKYPKQAKAGYCIDGVAACRLAYQFFNHSAAVKVDLPPKADYVGRRVTETLAVRLAGEYDVWDKRDPRAEIFQFGLKVYTNQLNFSILLSCDEHADEAAKRIFLNGMPAKSYSENVNEEIVKAYSFDVQFEGLTFLALNTARCNSLTFESGIKPYHDGLLGFRYDGNQWTISLYGVPHKPEIDLSVIASNCGGGGHKQACGFQASSLPFCDRTS